MDDSRRTLAKHYSGVWKWGLAACTNTAPSAVSLRFSKRPFLGTDQHDGLKLSGQGQQTVTAYKGMNCQAQGLLLHLHVFGSHHQRLWLGGVERVCRPPLRFCFCRCAIS